MTTGCQPGIASSTAAAPHTTAGVHPSVAVAGHPSAFDYQHFEIFTKYCCGFALGPDRQDHDRRANEVQSVCGAPVRPVQYCRRFAGAYFAGLMMWPESAVVASTTSFA